MSPGIFHKSCQFFISVFNGVSSHLNQNEILVLIHTSVYHEPTTMLWFVRKQFFLRIAATLTKQLPNLESLETYGRTQSENSLDKISPNDRKDESFQTSRVLTGLHF